MQHVTCYNCTSKASSKWDTEQSDWLFEELEIDTLVDLIYEFAADHPQDSTIDQIGYEVARTRSQYKVRFMTYYKPILKYLLVNPSKKISNHIFGVISQN